MVQNYLKTALRNINKNRIYSIINILGLSLGLACFIIVVSYNKKELSYESGFSNANRIFRLTTKLDVNGIPNHYPLTHYPAPADMMSEFPEVEAYLRLYTPTLFGGNPPKIRFEDNIFSEANFFVTDSTFFDFFEYDFKYGNPKTALLDPYAVVLTDETAKKYFGDVDPLGKTLAYNDSIILKVTGVLKRQNFNTHLKFDFLSNTKRIIRLTIPSDIDLENEYVGIWYYGYVKTSASSSGEFLQAKLSQFTDRHFTQRYKDNNAMLELQSLPGIHLNSGNMVAGDISPPGNINYVYVLGIVGICVLIVACFNFINMATSRSLARSKEVGVRKAIGAERMQLVNQFVSEAIIITIFAGLGSCLLVILFLPAFNSLADSNIKVSQIFTIGGIGQILCLFIAVGGLVGFYPAIVLSGMKPSIVLKGSAKQHKSKFSVRKGLVVFQFAVSLVLITGTGVVLSQINFLKSKDMGFDKELVLMVTDPGIPTVPRFPVLKNELLNIPGVEAVTSLSHDLGQKNLPFYPIKREGKDEEIMLPVMFVGFDFLETFKIAMKEGRFFDINARGDSSLSFIINESAAKNFGWEKAENRMLTFGASPSPDQRVIGVIEDFNFDPLRNNIGPLVIKFGGFFSHLAIKLKSGDHNLQVKSIEKVWKEVYPDGSFNYYFLDQGIDNAYAEEQKLAKIYTVFCSLAIFIACLGLFALASYTIEHRKKEMAVRKVLGSSSRKITFLIYKEFIILIAIAFIFSLPASLFMFEAWLEKFAYRVSFNPLLFVFSLVAVLLISIITISYQTVKASRTNPATVLKAE